MSEKLMDTLCLEIAMKLDSFLRGQQELMASVGKVRETLLKHGKEVENSTMRATEAVAALSRGYQGLFGLLLGGTATAAMYAAKNFAENLADSNAALGRFAANAGISPQSLSAWGALAELYGGGNRQSTDATIANLRNQISAMQNSGQLSGEWAKLYGLTNGAGVPFNLQGSTENLIETAARNLQIAAGVVGRSRAIEQGGKLGLDTGTMNAILSFSTWDALKDKLGEVRKSLTPSDEDINKATRLQTAFANLWLWVEKLERQIGNAVDGPLGEFLNTITDFVKYLSGDKDQAKAAGGAQVDQYKQRNPIRSWINRRMGWADDPEMPPENAPSGGNTGAAASFASGTSHGWWTPERQQFAINHLMKNAGLSEVGAKAMVARWAYIEAPNGPGEVNPTSGAQGIGQWLGPRQGGYILDNDFKAFISQLEKAEKEMNEPSGPQRRAGDALRSAKTNYQGARGASMFERAEGYSWFTGLDNFTAKTQLAIPSISGAALAQAANGPTSNYSNSSSAYNLNGVTINTQANDAYGLAADLPNAMFMLSQAKQWDTGPH